MRQRATPAAVVLAVLLPASPLPSAAPASAGARPVELTDLMRFRTLHDPVISDDGSWMAYEARPDRGDGEVVARSTDGADVHRVERGASPQITADGAWMGALVRPTLEEREKATEDGEGEDGGPKTGFALLATGDGAVTTRERVKAFAFSDDGRWLALHHHEEEGRDGEEAPDEPEAIVPEVEPVPEEELAVRFPEEPAPEPEVEGVPQRSPSEEPEPLGREGRGEEPPPAGPEPEPGPEEPEEPGEPEPEVPEEVPPETSREAKEDRETRTGTTLVLVELASGREVEIPHVTDFAFDDPSEHLVFAVAVPAAADAAETDGGDGGGEGTGNAEGGGKPAPEEPAEAPPRPDGLYVHHLAAGTERPLRQAERGRYTALTWAEDRSLLGFVAAVDERDGEPGDAELFVWAGGSPGEEPRAVATSAGAPEGWFLPSANELAWSEDGERLFFGYKPEEERVPPDEEGDEGGHEEGEGEGEEHPEEEPFDPWDVEAILEERAVDVWHWDDPLIIPNQKKRWEEEKDRVYRAVWHRASDRIVPLADREMRDVAPVDNPTAALGTADTPYLKEITWNGWFRDLYRVSLEDGARQLVARKVSGHGHLSPSGRWVVWYETPHWYLFDGETGESRNLTAGLGVPFADEDHDYPAPAPGYGVADWVSDGAGDPAVLIYDKYDLWQMPTDPDAAPFRLTRGREEERIFRLVDLDPDEPEELDSVAPGERLLLTGYHDRLKHRGVWSARVGEPAESGLRRLIEGAGKTYAFGPKAEEAERILLTRESYTEFPDLWTARLDLAGEGLAGLAKLSDANPQLAEYGWGSAELVEWTSADGIPLEGVLIKPPGYVEGQRVPVLVYFYRFFTQRLHRFNEPVVNHRPSFPHYASHGYAIFLPDIRFEVGRPGLAATKALVSGVQRLIDLGIADPDAVGLHGHSWSGYQAAFVITQTDLFVAAAAGAPVSNMTSAYGGIRYGSGLARQFQYEQSQSRLGVSLWEGRDRYIENSPLFYADRIGTPLLIQFGDEDEAVPWTQGIELYLAMRRLGKPAWFLQYRGEPHHLKRYANKLDYSIKMREFFDHYLKGAPMPGWMAEGVPYRGE